MSQPPVSIAILVFPETTGAVVYGLYDLFHSAGRDWGMVTEGAPGPALFDTRLVARDTGPMDICNAVRITPQASMRDCGPADVICIPEINLAPDEPLAERYQQELDWIRDRFRNGATLAASCSGAMLFGEAGLLEGHEATTHWAWCDAMRQRFPGVTVHGQRALVVSGDEQRLIMAGGGTSWMDLALYIIARYAGVDAAMQVARINLIDWHDIGQQPFARLASTRQVEDAVIARCQSWIAQHYREPNPVSAMVRLSGLAERTFKRRFRLATGMAPLEYVQALRLEEAKQLLESTEQAVEDIASEVGYEDAGYFSRFFKRQVSLTPAQYRKRFGGMRRSLTEA